VSVLEVTDLGFGYAAEALFRGATFRVNAGERVSLVAPNGAGKTTLLRLVAGELVPDQGAVLVAKGTSIGFLRQSHELDRVMDGTLLDAFRSSFGELVTLRHELMVAAEQAESNHPADLERLATLVDSYQHAGADQLERRIEMIADRLGFGRADLERPVGSLSGGERGRLALGIVLAQDPDLLLLDEPTNHLDLRTIRWLESYLRSYRGAALIVSHDRAFLDAVCPTTLELGRSTLRVYPLSYSSYEEARVGDLERETKLAEEQAALVQKTEDFIRRNLAGQKTKQAQARRRQLAKLERLGRPEDVWAASERMRLRFAQAPRTGDIVLEARGLGASRGDRQLFGPFDLLVRRGDRIGIVGPNGCGKTTLLELLAGRGRPEDRGDIRLGTNLCAGYFDQDLGSLDRELTAVGEIRKVRGDLSDDAAREYLARFRFWGDDPLRQVESLSGGERTRLCLAKLLLEPRNWLLLDEPTNHLDIPAVEILEEALCHFEGTVVLVSHDRRFLEAVTTRTISFEPEGLDLYEGGFRDFCEMQERRRRAEVTEARETAEAPRAPLPGAERHRARQKAARELEKKERRLGELETLVGAAERELMDLRALLGASGAEPWEKLHAWAMRERALTEQLERWTAEWVELSDALGRPEQEVGP
jgi:ATP-binding cassette subfamily F protein 3